MYSSKLKQSTLLIAFGLLAFTACKKNDDSSTSTDATGKSYASDYSKSEREGNDVESIADAAATTGSANFKMGASDLSSCATITKDTVAVPHVITIDFGATNCTGIDGRNRRGKIIVTYTGGYKDSGSIHTITFNNYFVNDNQITGSKVVTNKGMNASGNYYYSIVVNDTINLGTGNGMIINNSTRTRTWKEGYSTAARADDVYTIEGTATITRPNGYTVTVATTTGHPLQVATACSWIEAGIVTITNNQTNKVRTIDYGTGNCDAEAQVTFNGHTYNVTLP